jgi:hypothetical protein
LGIGDLSSIVRLLLRRLELRNALGFGRFSTHDVIRGSLLVEVERLGACFVDALLELVFTVPEQGILRPQIADDTVGLAGDLLVDLFDLFLLLLHADVSVLVGDEQLFVFPFEAHFRGVELLQDLVIRDFRDALVRPVARPDGIDLLEEAVQGGALELGIRQVRLKRGKPIVGDLLLILRNVQVRLLRKFEAALLRVLKFLLKGRDILEQRFDRGGRRSNGEIEVALDVSIRRGVDPGRDLLRVGTVQGDLNDAGVFDRLHLDHSRELPDGIRALLEPRVIVEIEVIHHPLGDVAALNDLVLCVEVTFFGVIPVGGRSHLCHVGHRRHLA